LLELLIDIEGQLPTRRYANALIQDLNLLSLIKLSPAFYLEDNGLLRDLFTLLRHFVNFSINDHTGSQYTRDEAYDRHCARLARLQRTALKHVKSKLTILALSNYGAIEQRTELENHLTLLTESELFELSLSLGIRTSYPSSSNITVGKELMLEILISSHERQKPFQEVVRDLSVLPIEVFYEQSCSCSTRANIKQTDLYDPSLLRNEFYNGSRSLAIPKLNLQYLTVGDFLWRSFILYRCESFYEVRKDMEDVIQRLQPRSAEAGISVHFDGASKMALPISKPMWVCCSL